MISRIRHFIFDHIWLKLISLLIAVLMWYGVARDPVSEIYMRVPVEFSHPPLNLDYTTDVMPQAQIRLRGPARVLREMAPENVRLVIDLKNAVPGERTYDLNTDQIRVPHDVEVLQVTPSRLRLIFDKRETREVVVHPRIVGTLPPGYHIESVVASPAMLTIAGPARRVEAIDSALTDAIDATGINGQASYDTMAYLPDPLVHIAGPGSIHVIIKTTTSRAGVP